MSRWGSATHWTPDRMVRAVRRFYRRYRRWPLTADFERLATLPDPTTASRQGLTLAELRRRAGAQDGGCEGWGGGDRGGWTARGTRWRPRARE